MIHFPFSLTELFVFLLYGAWFVFLIWFLIRLVRVLRVIDDIARSLRIMACDLREVSDDLKVIREKMNKEEPS